MSRRSLVLILCAALYACEDGRLDPVPSTVDSGVIRTPIDAGVVADSGVTVIDAGRSGDADAGTTTDASTATDAGTTACGFDDLGDPDRARVLLVGHGFTSDPNTPGRDVRTMTVASDGTLVDDGIRVDVGFRPARIEFLPYGRMALVLGEDGEVASLAVDGAANVRVIDTVALSPAFFGDLRIAPGGETAYAVGFDSSPTAGISTVHIACDGMLTVDTAAFFPLRLPQSLTHLGDDRWVVLGGQAVFDPVDPDDIRLFSASASGFTQLHALDVYMDAVNADRIAASHDGTTVLVPNNSGFSNESGQVAVIGIEGGTLRDRGRIMGLSDPADILWSADDQTVLVALFEAGRVAVLTDSGNGLTEVDWVAGIGLADQMAPIERGLLAGRVFITSVDPNTFPNITRLAIQGVGAVANLGRFDFADGSEHIPTALAVTP